MTDQAQKLREMARERPLGGAGPCVRAAVRRARTCRSIAILSGKGGVGKSSVAITLAMALARLRKKTLVVDGDLGLANVHILLGMNPRNNLSHVIDGRCSIDEAITRAPGDIAILPGASGLERMANLDAAHLEHVRRMLDHIEQEYDFLIIDAGAGIADSAMRLCAPADIALVVATPEPTSLTDAYATIKLLINRGGRGGEQIHVMVNLAAGDREGHDTAGKLRSLVHNFLGSSIACAGVLPVDRAIPALVRAQKSPFLEKPGSRFVTRIQAYARSLCGIAPRDPDGFFARLLKRRAGYGSVD
jgi:flagellar biosynthesis protein FlhG